MKNYFRVLERMKKGNGSHSKMPRKSETSRMSHNVNRDVAASDSVLLSEPAGISYTIVDAPSSPSLPKMAGVHDASPKYAIVARGTEFANCVQPHIQSRPQSRAAQAIRKSTGTFESPADLSARVSAITTTLEEDREGQMEQDCRDMLAAARLSEQAAADIVGRAAGNCFSSKMTRKYRAVIIGITYKNNDILETLRGPINDVREIYGLLRDSVGFNSSSIRVLADDDLGLDNHPVISPTKSNIIQQIGWLTDGMKMGDLCFFFFAGHGDHVKDKNGDEITGMDQILCPVDFTDENFILDDDLLSLLARRVPPGSRLFAAVDACRSGSVLDLPNQYEYITRGNKVGKVARLTLHNRTPLFAWDDTQLCGETVLICACDDTELAADLVVDESLNISMGAFTYAVTRGITNICKGTRLTYGELLDFVKKHISCRRSELTNSYLAQIPLLSSSHVFDLYSTEVML